MILCEFRLDDIAVLVVDSKANILFLHRSDKVRSAKNVWSIPSGEHELGESIENCAYRELLEEYGLVGKTIKIVDQYENIAGDAEPPHYHWVVSIYLIGVDDVYKAVNKEPDKHDQMLIVNYLAWDRYKFFVTHEFHPSLHARIRDNICNWL